MMEQNFPNSANGKEEYIVHKVIDKISWQQNRKIRYDEILYPEQAVA